VYLIDQHIYITMKKLNRVVGLRFYFSLIKDVVRGLLGKQPKVALDLKKAPSQELIAVAMEHMKQYYPKLYDVLVEQRNKVMVNRIMHITEKNEGKLLVIVGAGHVAGMKYLLENRQV